MAALPYVTAPGNIERALNGIKSAATPANVSQDFVKTILKIPGGSGNQMTSYLRKIGFASGTDGTPTDLYKAFRNPVTEGKAAAQALKAGYKALYVRNEYMHELDDKGLRGLVIEETGEGDDSNVVSMIVSSIKAIKKFAKWGGEEPKEKAATVVATTTTPDPQGQRRARQANEASEGLRMNLGYTINLNLPATSDVAVFNAIFKSLKEHLLKDNNE